MKKAVTVSIVDDDCELTAKISAYLNQTSDYRCISSYTSAEEALAQLPKDSPDVVLMDINLGGMNGIECVRQLRPSLPNTPVVMLTVFEDTDKIFRAIAAGASGYLLKRMPPSKLLDAIAEVVGGGSPMSAPIARLRVESEPCARMMSCWRIQYAIAAINRTKPYRADGAAVKWFSPIHAVVNGMRESQNNRCRFAHRIPPVTPPEACSMWW